jgi:hypothetical protein
MHGGSPEACTEAETIVFPTDQPSTLDEAIRSLESSEPGLAKQSAVPSHGADDTPAPEQVPAAIAFWLGRFHRNSAEAARNIRELAAKAPDQTVDALLPLYAAGSCETIPLVAGILGRSARTAVTLCNLSGSLEEAIRLAQSLERQEPRFDAHFAKSLLDDDQITEEALQRGLTIMENFRSSGRLVPILIQFLRNPESRIRSRAALMLGRIMPTPRLMYRLMQDRDPRVRANFVEGLWNSAADHSTLFLDSLHDSNQRVVGNALIGLHRSGQTGDVITHVARFTRHPDRYFRAMAAWVMGQTGDERFIIVLRHMLHDQDPLVRQNAFRELRRMRAAQATRSPEDIPGQPA